MRYTTIIDISEYSTLYNNQSIRLVYLHLVLRSGYHDHDRDLAQLSIRRLAMEVGLSVGAVRHALTQLLKYQMLVRQGPMLQVRKFVVEQPISKRSRNKREEKQELARKERIEQQERQAAKRKVADEQRAAFLAQGKTSFMVYYEEQLELAKKGDVEAAHFVETQKATYAAHARQVEQDKQKNNQKQ